jgi:DNA transformation protein
MVRNDAGIAWFLELLASAGQMSARRMFGGTGLYAGGLMIALEADGTLYLKADDHSRADFDAAGGVPFEFESRRGTVITHYLTPPDEALDSPDAMRPWAMLALQAAQRAAAKKAPRGRKSKR